MVPIPVLSTAPTQLDHMYVAVTQAINSMKMDYNVMVSLGYKIVQCLRRTVLSWLWAPMAMLKTIAAPALPRPGIILTKFEILDT